MFKRGKNDEAPADAGAPSSFSSGQTKTPETRGASGRTSTSEDTATAPRPATQPRTIPAYETRKSTVRTLSSGHADSSQTAATPANLHVGRGLKLEGKIQSCDSLVIEGNVQATIESESLTITDTGDVTGEATVGNAEINGKFDGTLTVRGCLTINATGRITGTVNYGELKVEQGGKVSGQIESSDQKGQHPQPISRTGDLPANRLKDAVSA